MHHLRGCCPRHLDACQRAQGHVEKRTEAATRSYYKLKQDGSILRLVWTGYRENVDVPPNTFDSPKAKRPAQKPEVKKKFQESFDDLQGTTATE